jgi:hypothetical protein
LSISQFLFECRELFFPVGRVHASGCVAGGVAFIPECATVGTDEWPDKFVVAFLVPLLPAVVSLANADEEARVGIGGGVGAGDEVVGLEDEMPIIRVAIAIRDAGTKEATVVCEYASTVASNYNFPHIVLDFVFNEGGVACSLLFENCALHS